MCLFAIGPKYEYHLRFFEIQMKANFLLYCCKIVVHFEILSFANGNKNPLKRIVASYGNQPFFFHISPLANQDTLMEFE